MHETWPVYRVNLRMCLHWSYLYWDIIYASVVYCDIVIYKPISYCMAWLQLHFISLLFLFIFLYLLSTFFSAKFTLRIVLYCVDSRFSHSPKSAHCLPTKISLNYSFHFLLGITVFPREIEKQILGGKRGYMTKVKKVNKYELLNELFRLSYLR